MGQLRAHITHSFAVKWANGHYGHSLKQRLSKTTAKRGSNTNRAYTLSQSLTALGFTGSPASAPAAGGGGGFGLLLRSWLGECLTRHSDRATATSTALAWRRLPLPVPCLLGGGRCDGGGGCVVKRLDVTARPAHGATSSTSRARWGAGCVRDHGCGGVASPRLPRSPPPGSARPHDGPVRT